MNHDLPPLDDELRRMLSNARHGAPVPQGAEERVRSLLAASVPALAPALQPRPTPGARVERAPEPARVSEAAAASWRSPVAVKVGAAVVGAFLAGGLAGAALHARLASGDAARARPSDAPVAPPPPMATASSTATEATPAPLEPRISEQRNEGPSSVESPSDLGAERALLDGARRAFGEGNAVAALSAIGAHARRFPSGRLQEEREALAVKALAAAGRYGEARARADKFRSRYPNSILLPSVTAAVQQIP